MMVPYVLSDAGPTLLRAGELVSFGDFVAHIAATNGAGDCGQGTAVAATHMTTDQATEQGTNAYAKWAVLCDRSRLLIRRGLAIIARLVSLSQLGAVGVIGGLVTTRVFMMHDGFVLHNLPRDWCRCGLLCQRDTTATRHFCCRTAYGCTM